MVVQEVQGGVQDWWGGFFREERWGGCVGKTVSALRGQLVDLSMEQVCVSMCVFKGGGVRGFS